MTYIVPSGHSVYDIHIPSGHSVYDIHIPSSHSVYDIHIPSGHSVFDIPPQVVSVCNILLARLRSWKGGESGVMCVTRCHTMCDIMLTRMHAACTKGVGMH